MVSSLPIERIQPLFPSWLQKLLHSVQGEFGDSIYITGGTVRDLLLGIQPEDIDLTVPQKGMLWGQRFAEQGGGVYIPLDEAHDTARVIIEDITVDFSSFRQGAETIEEELALRDVTINSLGILLDPLLSKALHSQGAELKIIDPSTGASDLGQGVIRATFEDTFKQDPLRLLRVYRFSATTSFEIEAATLGLASQQAYLIHKVSRERIDHELDLIMGTRSAARVFAAMARYNILWELIPELKHGVGMQQPASHHLDVFHHSLEALAQMELLLAEDDLGFSHQFPSLCDYAQSSENQMMLKWAALLHDIGKPVTCELPVGKGDKITFYNHDLAGGQMVGTIAERFRWSKKRADTIEHLVAAHMRPFHLANVARMDKVSVKACIRLIKNLGENLPGLFLVAMADARAGRGDKRPDAIEAELISLYEQIETVRMENVAPVLHKGLLITGKDLIQVLGLQPGPIFKVILEKIENAQMENSIHNREEALELAKEVISEE